jgi:hypothetical protein
VAPRVLVSASPQPLAGARRYVGGNPHCSLSRVPAIGSRATRRYCVRRGGAGPGGTRARGRAAIVALDSDGGLDSEVARKCSHLGKRCLQVSLHTHISPRPLGPVMGWWRPAARSRLVTGRSRRGGPYAVTARHAQSRRCGFGHGRHGAGPAARAPSARHAGVARPRKARLRDRSAIALCGTSRHLRLSCSPLPCLRSRRCSRDLAATLRSRLRSKMSQGTKCRLPGSSCHATIGARIVPWRQPGDRAVYHPIASTALLRPDPDVVQSRVSVSERMSG